MPEHEERQPIERALEVIIYAPIGLALFARDLFPPLIDQAVTRGKERIEQLGKQVENQVTQARIVGQFAVAQGQQQFKRDVIDRLRAPEPEVAAPEPRVAAHPAAPTAPAASSSAGRPSGNGAARADSSGLPIPDYDELSASQVVARLGGLTPEELDAVRAYEECQRQRKTILTRIEQLTA